MFKQPRITKSLLEGLWCVQTAQNHQISVRKASGVLKQLRVTKSLLEGLWCLRVTKSQKASGVFKQLRVTKSTAQSHQISVRKGGDDGVHDVESASEVVEALCC